MTRRIDLNADLGEGYSDDDALMEIISSCNIACGGHAGDNTSMRHALTTAAERNVAVGAHVSFPDRENFGRAKSTLNGAALEDSLRSQIETLLEIAGKEGVEIVHLKPHGALYNMAAVDVSLSKSIQAIMGDFLPGRVLVGPPGSELEAGARQAGIPFRREGFADRAYEPNGRLRDRNLPGAVLANPAAQTAQALQIACNRSVTTHDGQTLHLPAETLCIHGDTPSALQAARAIRKALMDEGVEIAAP